MKFLVLKKRTIFAVIICVIVIIAVFATFFSIHATAVPKQTYSIVIDSGHGGRDGGAIGKTTGISESELNLKYAKKLQSICEEFGIKVVMTRTNMEGLYDDFAENKKKSEMERRKNIINSSGADLMVSLHMNSFPISSCSGAQVFYAKGSESGFNLAKKIQQSICRNFENARDYVTVGDYFVLNYSIMPAVLIECGFLSNPQEEKNLQNDEYCEKFCYDIFAGIIDYFQM